MKDAEVDVKGIAMLDHKRRSRRRIYPDERRRWLEQYEGGKSLSALAKETGRNIRTIKGHVQRASDERERTIARTDLYRQAVANHNNDLLSALGGVRESLVVPQIELLTVLAHFPLNKASLLPALLEFQYGDLQLRPVIGDERDVRLLELAREHLRRDRDLWGGFDEWRRVLEEYAEECFELGRRVGTEASEKLAVELTSREQGATGVDEGLHEGFVSWPCRLSVEAPPGDAIGDHVDKLKVTDRELRYQGDVVATLSSSYKLKASHEYFLELIATLPQDQGARRIADMRRQLGDGAQRLRRRIGDVLLIGLVPGRCSVCRRVGL